MSSIAFLGLGTMGAGMVRNLVAAGREVIVWNRTGAKAQRLRAELGAEPRFEIAARPIDAARAAEIVILCVSGDEAVHELVLGPEGIGPGLSEGDLLIDCGTTSQALTRALELATFDIARFWTNEINQSNKRRWSYSFQT